MGERKRTTKALDSTRCLESDVVVKGGQPDTNRLYVTTPRGSSYSEPVIMRGKGELRCPCITYYFQPRLCVRFLFIYAPDN